MAAILLNVELDINPQRMFQAQPGDEVSTGSGSDRVSISRRPVIAKMRPGRYRSRY
jgi:hypothetical protein